MVAKRFIMIIQNNINRFSLVRILLLHHVDNIKWHICNKSLRRSDKQYISLYLLNWMHLELLLIHYHSTLVWVIEMSKNYISLKESLPHFTLYDKQFSYLIMPIFEKNLHIVYNKFIKIKQERNCIAVSW